MATPKWRRSLRNKIIAWSFVPTAIILLAVALVNFYSYQRVTQDLVIERDQQLVSLSASQLASRLAEHTDALTAVVRSADVFENDVAAQRAALQRASKRFALFDGGVVIISTAGTVIAAEPGRPDIMGANWNTKPFFRQMLRQPGPVFSDAIDAGPGSSPVVVVGVPIVGDQGQFVGCLAGMFRISETAFNEFYGDIVALRLDERGSAYVLDSSGLVLYHTDPAQIGSDYRANATAAEALGAELGYTRTVDAYGAGLLANYTSIPGTDWHLVTEEDWGSLMGSSQGYRLFLLVLLALGVIVPALVVRVAAGRLTRPIVQLIEAAKQVAGGNFGQSIHAPSGDEIEELATQFSLMSAQLKESYANLEQKVSDRTRALAALNSIATSVSQSLDLHEVMGNALEETLAVVNMDAGAAYRLEPDARTLTLISSQGISREFLDYDAHSPEDLGAPILAATTAEVAVRTLEDYTAGEFRDAIAREGFALIISVPLMAKGKVVGVVNLAARSRRDVTPEERSLLLGIGHQAGMAVENANLYRQAELSAAVAERNRLARDLHDAVTQTLFSASLVAEALPRIWDRSPEEGRKRLEQLRQLTRGALAEMRTLLLELRPASLTEAALGDLLRQLAEAAAGRSQVPVTVETQGDFPLLPEVQIAFYRVAQEALNNTIKHSGASQVHVGLAANAEGLCLTVRDNGYGFDAESITGSHFGLGIMYERANAIGADLEVRSAPGQGTEVTLIWTLDRA